MKITILDQLSDSLIKKVNKDSADDSLHHHHQQEHRQSCDLRCAIKRKPNMGDIRRLSPPGLKEEICEDEEENKNWKGVLIALLVISTICSFILLSIVLLTPHLGEQGKKELLKLEDYILEGYESRHYNGSWIGNNLLLYKEPNGTICTYDFVAKHKELLLEGVLTRQYEAQKYSISFDNRYLLLVHDVQRTGTHTSLARYTVFDTRLHTFTPLRVKEGEKGEVDSDRHQYAVWVPGVAALIVLVHGNNIYVFTPLGDIQHMLTENGKPDLVYNGVPEMGYEEHIWNSDNGIWLFGYQGGWVMCYSVISNEHLEQVPYILYGKSSNESSTMQSFEERNSNHGSYPKVFTYPYSKPGKSIPSIQLMVTRLTDHHAIKYKALPVRPPFESDSPFAEHYLSEGPVWISAYEFIAIWTKRSQDLAIISKCREQPTEWKCERLTEEKQLRPIGSLVLQSPPIVSSSGQKLFVRLPVSDGAAGTFDHIAQITMDGKKQFLTHGQFVVTEIFAYREDLQKLYYAATSTEEPGLRHVYSLKHQNTSNQAKIVSCISCHINESCLFNNAKFSPDGQHFVLECLGPDIPIHYLVNTETETVVEILDQSETLREWANQRQLPKIRHFSVGNIRLQLIIPANVNEYDDARYPLVIEMARFPGSQNVNYRNRLDWIRYLSSRREYITARIDTRGSDFQGDRHHYSIYRRIGEPELEDLKTAIGYLKQLPYVDSSKIAVWGHEYGGYLAAALTAKEDLIACSVAVSPISSWRNYLSAFSERYMGSPEENFLGYEQSELVKYSSLLKGRNLLLVHGTTDRRVNIQHTMQFMKSLTNNAVQYRTQLYPDSGSFETWDLLVRYHFYRTIEDFFARCFLVEDEDDEEDILPITKVIKSGKIKHQMQA